MLPNNDKQSDGDDTYRKQSKQSECQMTANSMQLWLNSTLILKLHLI